MVTSVYVEDYSVVNYWFHSLLAKVAHNGFQYVLQFSKFKAALDNIFFSQARNLNFIFSVNVMRLFGRDFQRNFQRGIQMFIFILW